MFITSIAIARTFLFMFMTFTANTILEANVAILTYFLRGFYSSHSYTSICCTFIIFTANGSWLTII